MTIAIWAVGTYCVLATATHIGSIAIAIERCRKPAPRTRLAKPQTTLELLGLTRFLRRTGRARAGRRIGQAKPTTIDVAGVSLVRPVCGLENHIEQTLRSAFELDYPRYEIIFCAATANDAAVPLVKRLIAEHPHIPARLLVG